MVTINTNSTGSSIISSWENDDFNEIMDKNNICKEKINSESNKIVVPPQEPSPTDHKLSSEFLLSTFIKTPDIEWDSYEDYITDIASFKSWEQYWRVILHIQRPSEIKERCYIHLFKDGIKPLWEDPGNVHGGRVMITYKKKDHTVDLHWEKIMLVFLGSQFHSNLISGLVLSVKRNFFVISIWVNDANRMDKLDNLVNDLRTYLDLGGDAHLRFMRHKEDSFIAY